MKTCVQCGAKIPKKIVIDGKTRNLQSRKYCFECSPFGLHNTRKLHTVDKEGKPLLAKICPECGREHTQKANHCFTCYFQLRQLKKIQQVQEIVGDACWFCEYNKTWRNLAFHHLDPQEKKFNLTTRELVGTQWPIVVEELKKCVLCCHNCHGEIHQGLISEQVVAEKYRKWESLIVH